MTTLQKHAWQTGKPPINHVVDVWYLTCIVSAYWDGEWWRTPTGTTIMDGIITHWRER